MRQMIHRWLAAPVLENLDQTRTAFLLHTFSLLTAAASLIYGLFDLIFIPGTVNELYIFTATLLSLAMNRLVQRGYIRSTGWMLAGGLWIIVALIEFSRGSPGSYQPDTSGYIIPVLLAGLVISGVSSIILALLSTLSGIVLTVLEITAGSSPFPAPLLLSSRLTDSLILFIAAIMIMIVRRSLNAALEQAYLSQQALDERNRQLEQEIGERRRAETALQARDENARQFQASLKALHEISFELTRIEDLDEMHRQAIELGLTRLGFDRLGLFLIDDDTKITQGRYGIDKDGNLLDIRYWQQPLSEMSSRSMLPEALSNKLRISIRHEIKLHDISGEVGTGWNALAILWNGDRSIGWLSADNLLHGQPLQDYQPEILSLYGAVLGHLTSLKQAEIIIRQSEERFFKAFHATPVAVGISKMHESQRIYVDVNESWIRLFGYSRDQIIGLDNTELKIWNVNEALSRRYDAMIEYDGSLREIELTAHTRTGEVLQLLGYAEKIEVGGKPHLLSMFQDITRLKQAEKQAVELALEKERVALLKELMSSLSHDLKTPLAVIDTSLYLLERVDEPQRQKDKIATIKRQVQYLNKYMLDILTISRLDYSPELSFARVDLNRLVRTIEERLHSSVESKNINLTLELAENHPAVLGDEAELNRALTNLMENAVNYTPFNGAIQIRTRTDGTNVIAEIADTGIGIEPAEIAAIFNHFYRTNSARTFHNNGTGLGLAIVKKIADMHGGSVEVESEFGAGSTFRLCLPAITL